MTWFTFIASIIASVAWPCVICVLLVLFKSDLSRLLNLTESIKYKDIAISFKKMEEQSLILEASHTTTLHKLRIQYYYLSRTKCTMLLKDILVLP